MVKLEDILVCTDDEWLSSGQAPLPDYILENFQIHWQRKFPNLSLSPQKRYIRADYFIFAISFKPNKFILEKNQTLRKTTSNTTNNAYKVLETYKVFDELSELDKNIKGIVTDQDV